MESIIKDNFGFVFLFIIGQIVSLLTLPLFIAKDEYNNKKEYIYILLKNYHFVLGCILFSWWMIIIEILSFISVYLYEKRKINRN